jgi:hypothetical protein
MTDHIPDECKNRKREGIHPKREMVKDIFWYAFVAVSLTCFFVCAWWLLYPYEPIVITEQPIRISNPDKKVIAGEHLVYCLKWDKKMDIHGVLTRKLLNDYIIDLRPSYATAKVGPDKAQISLGIPSHVSPGKYTLWWAASYKVNPLRTVTISAESEPFEIVANPNALKGKQGIQGKQGEKGAHGDKGPKGEKGGISIFGNSK